MQYKKLFVVLALFAVSGVVAGLLYFLDGSALTPTLKMPSQKKSGFELGKFESDEEFLSYLSSVENEIGLSERSAASMDLAPQPQASPSNSAGRQAGGQAAERVSTTNVQVAGIDEPDIVKTDGENIYVSSEGGFFYPLLEEIDLPAPERIRSRTRLVTAFPATALAKLSDITEVGELLLIEDTLIIFAGERILGYDVSKPEIPVKLWEMELTSSQYVSARLLNGNVYLVTRQMIDRGGPCPVPLLSTGGADISIACTEIYRPNVVMPVDTTYTVAMIDPRTGSVDETVSFVGSTGSSVVYVSSEAIYVSFEYAKDYAELYSGFFAGEGGSLISEAYKERLQRLSAYDISASAKQTEINVILEEYKLGLGDDARLKFENELNDKFTRYLQKQIRELERTGIVKVATHDLQIESAGEVPGRVLNQFSIDEYGGNLRVATTTGSRRFGGVESVNDVYVLDSKLRQIGSVENLGIDERIYSVRFMGDMGYVVTFREIDPFYVIDLKNPRKPAVAGELKIPGFSSYLHPLGNSKILGVGQEDGGVKLSVFDVSNPSNPTEMAKYLLSEYWTEVANNHHAFLLDSDNGVFFLPGGKGGYIFSYTNGLELAHAVNMPGVKRAVYIDNFMYLVGENEIVVFDENTWEEVSSLNLN